MEIKYCERCGAFLGLAPANRKYCTECYRIVSLERDRERKRKETEARRNETAKPVSCAWCGKPLVRRNVCQKYHKECTKAAYADLQKSYARSTSKTAEATNARNKSQKKPKPKSKDYTIEEIEAKAKELGTTYGKVVLGLQLGTIDRW